MKGGREGVEGERSGWRVGEKVREREKKEMAVNFIVFKRSSNSSP